MRIAVAAVIAVLGFGCDQALAKNTVVSFDGFCDVWDVSHGKGMGRKVAAHADPASCRTFLGEGFVHRINGTKFAVITGAYQGDTAIYSVALQYPLINGGFVDIWKTTDGVQMNFVGEHNYSISKSKVSAH